jgi:ribosomal protein S18 acetylase RimI-like enzyme
VLLSISGHAILTPLEGELGYEMYESMDPETTPDDALVVFPEDRVVRVAAFLNDTRYTSCGGVLQNVPAMTEAEAKQIAELLNERNQLARQYIVDDILKNADNYEYELRGGKVVACVERKKVQWYQWEIRHLSVLKEYEGKGVASLVYQRTEKAARTNGAAVLQCTIREENTRSEAFFKRQNFVKVGRFLYGVTGNAVGLWQKVVSKVPD